MLIIFGHNMRFNFVWGFVFEYVFCSRGHLLSPVTLISFGEEVCILNFIVSGLAIQLSFVTKVGIIGKFKGNVMVKVKVEVNTKVSFN